MTRSLIIGLVVLGLVAAGVVWVRSRALPSHGAGDDALPDVTLADGSVDAGEVRITLSLTPRTPVAFAKTRVRVRAETQGSAVLLDGARISFEMAMPMGEHRYSLVPAADGWQEAEAVLPLCPSGEHRWYATVEGTAAGQPRTARFRFDVKPPAP